MKAAPAVGERFGSFELRQLLHESPNGVLYRAYDPALDREAALKILLPGDPPDPALVQQFRDEARICAGLKHPHVVTVYASGVDAGHHFIAMQLLSGHSLQHMLQAQGAPAPERALRVLGQVAAALDYVHSKGLVHRDVKAANVVLSVRDDTATLIDFGLVKHFESLDRFPSATVVGTPAYMSPEQANGQATNASSDIYSFGVLAFELLAGRQPFRQETQQALLYAQVHEPAPLLSAIAPWAPKAVDRVLQRAMAKQPAERWPDATTMVTALDKALKRGVGPAFLRRRELWVGLAGAAALLAGAFGLRTLQTDRAAGAMGVPAVGPTVGKTLVAYLPIVSKSSFEAIAASETLVSPATDTPPSKTAPVAATPTPLLRRRPTSPIVATPNRLPTSTAALPPTDGAPTRPELPGDGGSGDGGGRSGGDGGGERTDPVPREEPPAPPTKPRPERPEEPRPPDPQP